MELNDAGAVGEVVPSAETRRETASSEIGEGRETRMPKLAGGFSVAVIANASLAVESCATPFRATLRLSLEGGPKV